MKKLFYLFVCAGFLSGCHVGHNSETLINNNQKSVNGIESSGFQTSNFGKYSNFNGVAYGDGIYVAVGNNGAISVSFDNGKSWSSVDSYASVNLNAVTFDNVGKKFYAVGNEGVIISSTNGIDWNSRTPLTPVINLLTVLAVDGNLFIGGQRGLVFEIDYRTGSVTLRGGLTAANVVSSGYDAKNGIMYIGNSDGSIQHKYISIWTTTQWTNPYYVSSSEITGVSFDSIDNVVLLSDSFGNVYWGGKFAWSAPLYTNFGKLSQIFYDIKSDSFLSVTNSGLAYSKDFNFWALTETGGVGYKNVLCNGEICVATGLNGLLRYSSSRDVNGIPQFLEPESVNFTKNGNEYSFVSLGALVYFYEEVYNYTSISSFCNVLSI